ALAREVELLVALPKFKMTEEFKLGTDLAKLGMQDAFLPGVADFTGMEANVSRQKLFISAVVHKAFVEVDEKGTEAAAATGVVMTRAAMPAPRPRAVFRADHPFVFLLRDRQTGSILFLGRLTNPA